MLDDDTLRALLATRTQGDWRAVRDDSAADACGGPEVWNVETADGSHVAELYDSDDRPDAAQRVETDATLCALAPSLAAEVLRLRAERDELRAVCDDLHVDVVRARDALDDTRARAEKAEAERDAIRAAADEYARSHARKGGDQ